MLDEQYKNLLKAIRDNSNLNKLAAYGGSALYADTNPHIGISATWFFVREATTLTTLSGFGIGGVAVDFLVAFNIGATALKTNDIFYAPAGYRITTITLATGSVIAYSS